MVRRKHRPLRIACSIESNPTLQNTSTPNTTGRTRAKLRRRRALGLHLANASGFHPMRLAAFFVPEPPVQPFRQALHGVVEGSKVRRRAKSVSNAVREPRTAHTLLKAPQSAFSTPRGRDVLLYPDRATFYNPDPADVALEMGLHILVGLPAQAPDPLGDSLAQT